MDGVIWHHRDVHSRGQQQSGCFDNSKGLYDVLTWEYVPGDRGVGKKYGNYDHQMRLWAMKEEILDRTDAWNEETIVLKTLDEKGWKIP